MVNLVELRGHGGSRKRDALSEFKFTQTRLAPLQPSPFPLRYPTTSIIRHVSRDTDQKYARAHFLQVVRVHKANRFLLTAL